MLDIIIDNYKRICNETYYNFEVYNLRAIDSLDLGEINARDLQMLIYTQDFNDGVTPGMIAQYFNISSTALSNRLVHLEHLGLIQRKSNLQDSRSKFISLTKLGIDKTNVYHEYVNDFIHYLRKNTPVLKLPTTFKAIKKIGAIILNHPINNTTKSEISKEILFDVQKYFSITINKFIEENSNHMKDGDLFLLTELFLHGFNEHKELTILANKLLIPYQTLMSKIKKFRSLGYIEKRIDNLYKFDTNLMMMIQGYMHLRVVLYHEFFDKLETYEREQIRSIFQLLKTYAISVMSKDRL